MKEREKEVECEAEPGRDFAEEENILEELMGLLGQLVGVAHKGEKRGGLKGNLVEDVGG